jgi:hypothetical protein
MDLVCIYICSFRFQWEFRFASYLLRTVRNLGTINTKLFTHLKWKEREKNRLLGHFGIVNYDQKVSGITELVRPICKHIDHVKPIGSANVN